MSRLSLSLIRSREREVRGNPEQQINKQNENLNRKQDTRLFSAVFRLHRGRVLQHWHACLQRRRQNRIWCCCERMNGSTWHCRSNSSKRCSLWMHEYRQKRACRSSAWSRHERYRLMKHCWSSWWWNHYCVSCNQKLAAFYKTKANLERKTGKRIWNCKLNVSLHSNNIFRSHDHFKHTKLYSYY